MGPRFLGERHYKYICLVGGRSVDLEIGRRTPATALPPRAQETAITSAPPQCAFPVATCLASRGGSSGAVVLIGRGRGVVVSTTPPCIASFWRPFSSTAQLTGTLGEPPPHDHIKSSSSLYPPEVCLDTINCLDSRRRLGNLFVAHILAWRTGQATMRAYWFDNVPVRNPGYPAFQGLSQKADRAWPRPE
jgi:hypothetical protein